MSKSSGWLSGQSRLIMNSALLSTLPSFASGATISSAMKNRKARICSALNSTTLNGSKASSRGSRSKSSIIRRAAPAVQRRDDMHLGEVDREGEDLRRGAVQQRVLDLEQDRPRQADQRRVHGDRHAVAHQRHRRPHRLAVLGVQPGDRRQHHDEADDGAQQAELHQRVAGEGAEGVRPAQPARRGRAAAASGRAARRPAARPWWRDRGYGRRRGRAAGHPRSGPRRPFPTTACAAFRAASPSREIARIRHRQCRLLAT